MLNLIKESKERFTEEEFESFHYKYNMMWNFEAYSGYKDNGKRTNLLKRSVQVSDAYAQFYLTFKGEIRFEIPRVLAGEFFGLLEEICRNHNAKIWGSDDLPISNQVIENAKIKRYDNIEQRCQVNQSFGYNSVWLCIYSNRTKDVLEELKMKKTKEVEFEEGLNLSWGEDKLMMIEPLNNWITIHGDNLIYLPYKNDKDYNETSDHYQKSIDFVNRLSSKFGKAGLFMDSEKSNISSAFFSESGELQFGFVQSELDDFETGDLKFMDLLWDKSPQAISGIYCVDPDLYLYSSISKNKVAIIRKKILFSLF